MKNNIITAASILCLILLVKIPALTCAQELNGRCFSYLGGEIMFDYDPDSNFLHYYKNLNQSTRDQQKNKLRRLEEIEINRELPDKQIPDIMTDISWCENSFEQSGHISPINKPLSGSNDEFDQPRCKSKRCLNKSVKAKKPSNYLITTPCGVCNNFPIIFTSNNEIVESTTYSVNLVRHSFKDESLAYSNTTPEPQTIFLFGSALISLGIFSRVRRRKTVKI